MYLCRTMTQRTSCFYLKFKLGKMTFCSILCCWMWVRIVLEGGWGGLLRSSGVARIFVGWVRPIFFRKWGRNPPIHPSFPGYATAEVAKGLHYLLRYVRLSVCFLNLINSNVHDHNYWKSLKFHTNHFKTHSCSSSWPIL